MIHPKTYVLSSSILLFDKYITFFLFAKACSFVCIYISLHNHFSFAYCELEYLNIRIGRLAFYSFTKAVSYTHNMMNVGWRVNRSNKTLNSQKLNIKLLSSYKLTTNKRYNESNMKRRRAVIQPQPDKQILDALTSFTTGWH